MHQALLLLEGLPNLIGCSAEEKVPLSPVGSCFVHVPGCARPAPAPAAAGTSVVPCIGRRVTGGRAARTGMPLLQPFGTPLQNPLYIFQRRLITLLQRPNGVFRVTRSSCGGRGTLPGSIPPDRSTGQAVPEACVGYCGTTKAYAHGVCSPPEARSGTEPETALEARRWPAFSSKQS
ncbi:hypothetical protein DSECCO2_641380 [anaerobic digester metagenome]